MKYPIDFSVGPSALYPGVEDHVKRAFREGIPTLSHRSTSFEHLYRHTIEHVRELLNIPSSHTILFTGSATEIWERIMQNLVEENSLHFVNGGFSEKCYKVAIALKKNAQKIQVPHGSGFDTIPQSNTELIAITHNESSTGVALPKSFIYEIKEKNPHSLLVVDAVSSLPYVDFDYSKIDSVYCSVQKGFGLPPGLGVWIVNDHCIAKAEKLLAKGKSVGTPGHSLLALIQYALKNQTPYTPNTVAIYLLGKVAEDMIAKGIDIIRRETNYKAALLYQLLATHTKLNPFVKDATFQSPTVIVAESNDHTTELNTVLRSKGIRSGAGYGVYRSSHIRFGNFPAHSKEQVAHLSDILQAI